MNRIEQEAICAFANRILVTAQRTGIWPTLHLTYNHDKTTTLTGSCSADDNCDYCWRVIVEGAYNMLKDALPGDSIVSAEYSCMNVGCTRTIIKKIMPAVVPMRTANFAATTSYAWDYCHVCADYDEVTSYVCSDCLPIIADAVHCAYTCWIVNQLVIKDVSRIVCALLARKVRRAMLDANLSIKIQV